MSTALALIAHDLKNALGVLEGELESMIDDPTPIAAQAAYMHCTDLRRHFIQFLTLYSAESGQLDALCEDESPAEMLQHMLRVWQLKAKSENLPLHISIKDEDQAPVFWYFDRRLVQMALDAALHNAMRFARSRVTVAAYKRDGALVWEVADDGPGLDATDPSAPHATGLGTALCEAVARAHHLKERCGHVAVRRDEAAQETIFEMLLP